MTNEEAIAELERQIGLFPQVVLSIAQFNVLRAMASSSGADIRPKTLDEEFGFEDVPKHTQIYSYEHGIGTFILDLASARLLHQGAMTYLTKAVTTKLLTIPRSTP